MHRRRALQLLGMGGAFGIATAPVGTRRLRAADLDDVKIATPLAISDAPIIIAEHKG